MADLKFRLVSFITPVLLFIVNRKRGLKSYLAVLGERTIAIKLKRLDRPLLIEISDGLLKRTDEIVGPEVIFKGSTRVFFEIALGIVDPDTAFFERKIIAEGSTPFSLLLKNALDRYSR